MSCRTTRARCAASVLAAAALAACGHAPESGGAAQRADHAIGSGAARAGSDSGSAGSSSTGDADDPETVNARLAAIQKAMNELDKVAQQCWAAAATERFDIEGEISLQIDVAPAPDRPATATVVHDTARNVKLSTCLVQIMAAYHWAPPLYGQSIQLPFKFRAPDGQNTIDRALVAWHGQGRGDVSVAVLLDENNTGSDAASMVELAIAAGGATGLRRADRAELWYFLGAGQVRWPSGSRAIAAGDMMYVPRGAVREVSAAAADLHAMIAMVPGGREGAARSGALPTPEVNGADGARSGTKPRPPLILPAASARTHGGATVYADAAQIADRTLSASILTLPAGAQIAEHVHAGEAELMYVLAGTGTLTVAGVDLPVTATTVVQIPRNTRHAFVATSDVRVVVLYTPSGPEQWFKRHS